ncbi:hypothetical protein K2Z83_05705 [Oscillochloris sp. ZM17-4]|uniref:hypothetical protein n=1 Tax=Oscillochloris sp. ZM17-4 TaxID=2866714 RepID=UPI001C72CD99|nr:hypothetical protein [Oscillochloris sp. ZM17-4]MBX0327174.1 hypothetical protein [Oscillochloris sp. ZM17-4]
MRFRTHAITSALAGVAIYPRSPLRAAAVLLSGTLIDVDHFVLYALQTGDWSVAGALVYNRYRHDPGLAGDSRPRYGPLRSWLHNPLLLLTPLWVAASRRAALRPVAIGLSLHMLLDYIWWPRYTLAFWRAGRRCAGCGRTDRRLTVHWRRAWGEPEMRTLCRPCFEISLRRERDG